MSKAHERRKRATPTRAEEIKQLNLEMERQGKKSRYIDDAPELDWNNLQAGEKSYLDHMAELVDDPQFVAVVEQGKKLDGRFKGAIDKAWDTAIRFMKDNQKATKEKVELGGKLTRLEMLRNRLEHCQQLLAYFRQQGMLMKAKAYEEEERTLVDEIAALEKEVAT